MGWKKKQKFLCSVAITLGAVACIPTLYWAITSVISGNYGGSIDNLYGQPLHPVIILIVFFFLAIILPIIYLKVKKKRIKGDTRKKKVQKKRCQALERDR